MAHEERDRTPGFLGRLLRSREQLNADIDHELRFHVKEVEEDLVAAGASPMEARREALRRFGDPAAVEARLRLIGEERLAREQKRERLRFSSLDFRLGLRMLARYPGLTLVGGLAMAFAIGLGAAGFEAVQQVVSPRLPFPEAERLVALGLHDVRGGRGVNPRMRTLDLWREELEFVVELGGYTTVERNLVTGDGQGAPIPVAEISAAAFRLTGVPPLLGRTLLPADEAPGAPSVLLLGHGLWQTRFGGDAGVLGQTVRLGREATTIIGVMPEDFAFPFAHSAWAPLPDGPDGDPEREVAVFGMLAAGATRDQAQVEVDRIGAGTFLDGDGDPLEVRAFVGPYAGMSLNISCGVGWTRCLQYVRAAMYSSNLLFLAFLGLVCVNVALLMFARAAARESEIIVRSALGATRARVITQLVAEALVLAGVAAVLGVAAAAAGLKVAVRLLDDLGQIPFWWNGHLSWPSVAWAVGLALVGATIAGALPGFKITAGRGDRMRQVGAGGGGLRFGGIWTGAMVLQVALTVIVVAFTVYTIQLTTRMARFDLGVAGSGIVAATIGGEDGLAETTRLELRRRLHALPDVTGVTFASQVPGEYHDRWLVEVEGADAPPRGVQGAFVDPDFFAALELPILSGRAFDSGDASAEGRALIANEAFVERVLGGRNALGRRVRFLVSENPAEDAWGPWFEIVGVSRQAAMGVDPELSPAGLYRPLVPGNVGRPKLLVRVRSDAAAFAPEVRRVVTAVDPTLRLREVQRLEAWRDAEAAWYGVLARLLLGASALVLALSLAGIYAVLAFTVARRTREIGIRLALGAGRRTLVVGLFRRPMLQAAAGVVLGVGFLVAMSDGITPRVGLIVLAFTLFMFGVCALACIVPARRALRVEPTEALRAES
ncbi:MAG: ABC transporter permease [Gemmatimonadota bacterium]